MDEEPLIKLSTQEPVLRSDGEPLLGEEDDNCCCAETPSRLCSYPGTNAEYRLYMSRLKAFFSITMAEWDTGGCYDRAGATCEELSFDFPSLDYGIGSYFPSYGYHYTQAGASQFDKAILCRSPPNAAERTNVFSWPVVGSFPNVGPYRPYAEVWFTCEAGNRFRIGAIAAFHFNNNYGGSILVDGELVFGRAYEIPISLPPVGRACKPTSIYCGFNAP